MKKSLVITNQNISQYRTSISSHPLVVFDKVDIETQVLSNLVNLQSLRLRGMIAPKSNIRKLRSCPSLRYLDLSELWDSPRDLSGLITPKLTNLIGLRLNNLGLGTDLSPVFQLSNLRQLAIPEPMSRVTLNYRGIKNLTNLRYLEIEEPTDDIFNSVRKLPNLKRLKINARNVRQNFQSIPSLKHLTITLRPSQLNQLEIFTDLHTLELDVYCPSTDTDIKSLQSESDLLSMPSAWLNPMTRLQRLNMKNFTQIERDHCVPIPVLSQLIEFTAGSCFLNDLHWLSKCTRLKNVLLRRCVISSLDGLSSCQNIRQLHLDLVSGPPMHNSIHTQMHRLHRANNRPSLTFEELSTCTRIEKLVISGVNISGLDAIANMTNLRKLGINNCQITDTRPLRYCINVERLWLSNSVLKDIDHLIAPNLRSLNLENTNLTNISLVRFPKLDTLLISGCKIKDLRGLQNLTQLRYIVANHCGLESIDDLISPNLSAIIVASNSIKHIPFDRYPKLTELDASNNKLEHVEGIEHCPLLQRLILSHNQILDFHPIAKLRNIDTLKTDGNPHNSHRPEVLSFIENFGGKNSLSNFVPVTRDATKANVSVSSLNQDMIPLQTRIQLHGTLHETRAPDQTKAQTKVPIAKSTTKNDGSSCISNTDLAFVRNLLIDHEYCSEIELDWLTDNTSMPPDLPVDAQLYIRKFCADNTEHPDIGLTFRDLLIPIWIRIENHPDYSSLVHKLGANIIRTNENDFNDRFVQIISVLMDEQSTN